MQFSAVIYAYGGILLLARIYNLYASIQFTSRECVMIMAVPQWVYAYSREVTKVEVGLSWRCHKKGCPGMSGILQVLALLLTQDMESWGGLCREAYPDLTRRAVALLVVGSHRFDLRICLLDFPFSSPEIKMSIELFYNGPNKRWCDPGLNARHSCDPTVFILLREMRPIKLVQIRLHINLGSVRLNVLGRRKWLERSSLAVGPTSQPPNSRPESAARGWLPASWTGP